MTMERGCDGEGGAGGDEVAGVGGDGEGVCW